MRGDKDVVGIQYSAALRRHRARELCRAGTPAGTRCAARVTHFVAAANSQHPHDRPWIRVSFESRTYYSAYTVVMTSAKLCLDNIVLFVFFYFFIIDVIVPI